MIRVVLRIEREQDHLATLQLHVNGQRASGGCGIILRTSELVEFINRLKPDGVLVDREMVSAHLVALLGPIEREHAYIRYV